MPFFPDQRARREDVRAGDVARPEKPDEPEAVVEAKANEGAVARFVAVAPRYRLADVVLPDGTRERLEALISKIEHHRTLYEEWDLAAVDPGGRRVALNLYGPPGTGKSMCAEGIAERLTKPIVTVSYAELESKYVGETPKNIVAAFEAARAQDAVLFFDEADSILGRRLTSVTQSADHGVNVSRSTMLLQLDRFEGVVVFATNLAKNYDGAFVRRILGHVEIPLPDLAGRVRLAERLLRPRMPKNNAVTADFLANLTDGLSGGEMLQAVIGAATHAVCRDGARRRVEPQDIEAEVAALRKGRAAVGLDTPREPRVVSEVVLPRDVALTEIAENLAEGSDA